MLPCHAPLANALPSLAAAQKQPWPHGHENILGHRTGGVVRHGIKHAAPGRSHHGATAFPTHMQCCPLKMSHGAASFLPLPARGERSDCGAIRVRGRFSVGGARDRNVVGALIHRFRVAFLGAPSPGARAFHARTLTSPRARGEVRGRPHHARFFPGQPCAHMGSLSDRDAQRRAPPNRTNRRFDRGPHRGKPSRSS